MSETTSHPVELYRARNLPEAYTLRLLLEANGITSLVVNDLLQGALGEIPLGWSTAPRVVVKSPDEAAARKLLEEFLHHQRDRNEAVAESALTCLACGESMGDEAVCLKCGWTYGEATRG